MFVFKMLHYLPQLTSYGGFLNYTVYYETGNNNRLTNWPDVVLTVSNFVSISTRMIYSSKLSFKCQNFVEWLDY